MSEDKARRKFLKVTQAHGREYVYFIMGYKRSGDPICARLPPFDSPDYDAAYDRCLAERPATLRSDVASCVDRGFRKAAEAAQDQKPEWVYFIMSQSGDIKIGRSNSPFKRLATIQVGHAEHLTLMAVVLGGAELEREYHERFAAHRIKGEWFHPHGDIIDEIGHIGAFDQPSPPKPNKRGRPRGTKKARETAMPKTELSA